MKSIIIPSLFLAAALPMAAAETESKTPAPKESIATLRVETRLDYQRNWQSGLDGGSTVIKDNTGFEGKFLNIRLDGNITDNLSYSWRQRLNKGHNDRSFFDATDWVYLQWNTGRFSIAGGKQVVAIGGWEYDRAPIDLYSCSVFWNNIPCYQIGGSVAYNFTGNDKLMFQWCESPFFTPDNRNMYAYNLYWSGTHGIFSPLWSVNLLEYAPGHYINYIALGNKVSLGKWAIELDLMNRASSHQAFLFKDCSIMGEISVKPTALWRIHAKMTYDVNKSGTAADALVLDGTELKMIGGGVEFYPFSKSLGTLRFHANAYHSWGHNANRADVMQRGSAILDFGVKWDMNLLSIKR
ncbi:MAG: OprO/OprP family phosphate-selective porin [Alloprevotella sp.]|nr:OprO/OprP family phosphate-selective porin [Alloprevotella sp.]